MFYFNLTIILNATEYLYQVYQHIVIKEIVPYPTSCSNTLNI